MPRNRNRFFSKCSRSMPWSRLSNKATKRPCPDAGCRPGPGPLAFGRACRGTGEDVRTSLRVDRQSCAGDELVSHVLLLHGLHPVDLEARVLQALEIIRPLLRRGGGELEIIAVNAERVRVRVEADAGCGTTVAALEAAPIQRAIFDAAPEVDTVEVEGIVDSEPALMQVGLLSRATTSRSQSGFIDFLEGSSWPSQTLHRMPLLTPRAPRKVKNGSLGTVRSPAETIRGLCAPPVTRRAFNPRSTGRSIRGCRTSRRREREGDDDYDDGRRTIALGRASQIHEASRIAEERCELCGAA